jgi:hypothetical protein
MTMSSSISEALPSAIQSRQRADWGRLPPWSCGCWSSTPP